MLFFSKLFNNPHIYQVNTFVHSSIFFFFRFWFYRFAKSFKSWFRLLFFFYFFFSLFRLQFFFCFFFFRFLFPLFLCPLQSREVANENVYTRYKITKHFIFFNSQGLIWLQSLLALVYFCSTELPSKYKFPQSKLSY